MQAVYHSRKNANLGRPKYTYWLILTMEKVNWYNQ